MVEVRNGKMDYKLCVCSLIGFFITFDIGTTTYMQHNDVSHQILLFSITFMPFALYSDVYIEYNVLN